MDVRLTRTLEHVTEEKDFAYWDADGWIAERVKVGEIIYFYGNMDIPGFQSPCVCRNLDSLDVRIHTSLWNAARRKIKPFLLKEISFITIRRLIFKNRYNCRMQLIPFGRRKEIIPFGKRRKVKLLLLKERTFIQRFIFENEQNCRMQSIPFGKRRSIRLFY